MENVKFLKNEYGTGGAYPAVIDREISEDHDSKGIRLRLGSIIHPDADLLLSWPKVEKRIKELIRDGRYLNSAEKNHFPVWRQEQALRRERAAVGKRIMDVIHDFNDFETQLGNKEALPNLYVLSDCASRLYSGDKITLTLRENNFVLPLLRDALNHIISEETHLTDRCRDALKELDGDLFKHLEPTYDELNPPPPPPREYRFSLGDKVFLGTQEYELLHLGEEEVRLYDPTFPLINKELSREDFDRMVAENPLNDSHYVLAETSESVKEVLQNELPESPVRSSPIGRLEFLGPGGIVGERVEYTDPDKFVKGILDENYAGAPMVIVLYRDQDGNTIPQDFVSRLDPLPQGLQIVEYEQVRREQELAERLTEFLRAYEPEEYYGVDDENPEPQGRADLRLHRRSKREACGRAEQEGDRHCPGQAGPHQAGLHRLDLGRSQAAGKALQALQREVQFRPAQRVRRQPSQLRRYEPGDRAQAPPAQRRRPHSLWREHPACPRRGRGQNL